MKKVAIVYKFLPFYRVDFYEHLRKLLRQDNIELVLVYGKHKNEQALRGDETDLSWAIYKPNRVFRLWGREVVWQPCIDEIADCVLVITQQENRLLLNYFLMARRIWHKAKYAMWGHTFNMQGDTRNFGNHFRRFFITKCDWWFGYTKSAIASLVNAGFPSEKITVVQNAIDTKKIRALYLGMQEGEVEKVKKDLGISSVHVAIYCGGLYPQKDIPFILSACHLIRAKVPDFEMIFVGDGIEAVKVKEAADKYSWLHFVGAKFAAERVVYFKIAALQLMPKLVGLSILDSFAMEAPIVTTDNRFHGPEIEYLENGKNGLMVRDDLQVYADAVADTLLTDRYIEMASCCVESVQVYTVEQMADNFRNGILKCIGNEAPRKQ